MKVYPGRAGGGGDCDPRKIFRPPANVRGRDRAASNQVWRDIPFLCSRNRGT